MEIYSIFVSVQHTFQHGLPSPLTMNFSIFVYLSRKSHPRSCLSSEPQSVKLFQKYVCGSGLYLFHTASWVQFHMILSWALFWKRKQSKAKLFILSLILMWVASQQLSEPRGRCTQSVKFNLAVWDKRLYTRLQQAVLLRLSSVEHCQGYTSCTQGAKWVTPDSSLETMWSMWYQGPHVFHASVIHSMSPAFKFKLLNNPLNDWSMAVI